MSSAAFKPLPTVIIVDDEIAITRSLSHVLADQGFNILTTTNPEEALQWLQQDNIDVVISDQRMPSMQGTDFLTQAKSYSPHTQGILLTGYAEWTAAISAINDAHVFQFMQKPWDDEQIIQTTRQASQLAQQRKQQQKQDKLSFMENNALSERVWGLSLKIQQLESQLVQSQFQHIRQQLAWIHQLFQNTDKTTWQNSIIACKQLGEFLEFPEHWHCQLIYLSTLSALNIYENRSAKTLPIDADLMLLLNDISSKLQTPHQEINSISHNRNTLPWNGFSALILFSHALLKNLTTEPLATQNYYTQLQEAFQGFPEIQQKLKLLFKTPSEINPTLLKTLQECLHGILPDQLQLEDYIQHAVFDLQNRCLIRSGTPITEGNLKLLLDTLKQAPEIHRVSVLRKGL